MLNTFSYLLCLKLCWHNWLVLRQKWIIVHVKDANQLVNGQAMV